MAKKAISPIIAIVILIALVITLGGIISAWLSGFVSDASQHDTCAITTLYALSDASYSASNGQIKVKVKNSGRDDLYNFTIEADNGTVIAIIQSSFPSATYKLSPGQSQYILANSSGYNITNIDTIAVLVGSCPVYSSKPIKLINI